MRTTIRQVAQAAGVSTATVSYVINGTGAVSGETRARVQATIAELRYQPQYAAQALRGRSHTIALVLPGAADRIADPALAEVLAGVAAAAVARGYHLLLTSGGAEDEVALARSGRVDGLLLFDALAEDPRAAALARDPVPHVWVGARPSHAGGALVGVDLHRAAQLVTQHLLAQRRRRVALIALPGELAASEACFAGYAAALAVAGIALDTALVVEAGRTEADGYRAFEELLAGETLPDALLAASDELAFGALHAIHDAALEVGIDVAVAGMDDVPLAAHVFPPLTAVRQPRRALGSAAVALLDRQISGGGGVEVVLLDARLVVRASTAG